MWAGSTQRVCFGRFAGQAALIVGVASLAACGHDARLGLQCPQDEPSCAGMGGVVIAAGRGGSEPAPMATDAATPVPLDAGFDAGSEPPPLPLPDAQVAEPPAGACRSVATAFFACASGEEQPGTPHLRAGQSYTLRVRGDYSVDTTFQVQGASAGCTAVPFEPLTIVAGGSTVERCIQPAENLVLLVTVMSGDPQYWVQGLMAEVCDGCE